MDKVCLEKQMVTKQVGDRPLKVGLMVTLAVLTVVLILLASGGGIYIHQLQNSCSGEKIVPRYQTRRSFGDREGRHSVAVDENNHIEKQTTFGPEGTMTSIIAFNFNMRLISIYSAKDDLCYLIGGIREEIGSFKHALQMLEDNTEVPARNISYEVKDHLPVKHMGMLTDDMLPYCSKGNIFWLERSELEDDTAGREKRAICFWARYCYRGICIRVRRCFRG